MNAIAFELDVNPITHQCLHVSIQRGKRVHVSRAEGMERRTTYRQMIAALVPLRAKQRIAHPVEVLLQFWHRGPQTIDGDNCVKELMDALVQAKVFSDDNSRIIRRCTYEIVADGPSVRPKIAVTIEPYTRAAHSDEPQPKEAR